eukprot:CAMPEP_0178420024 /NCGR_PEP_ID=MMETSP0689_2-20121128/25916_1 /TAXON_ID=160604 /ORGANISM="Amphidinium massartii, Strain CS-259" /LENGTH=319 /DNA_ID=CAMNT_0020041487 /DNA_START=82 /DNA_END=1041 /DNA_ORIENTATION=-
MTLPPTGVAEPGLAGDMTPPIPPGVGGGLDGIGGSPYGSVENSIANEFSSDMVRQLADVDTRARKGWYSFKDLHEVPRLGLYDPRTTMLPIPGVSSGMLESGMNYDYLPRGTCLLAPVAPPSPLQQIVGHGKRHQGTNSPYSVGHPARLVNLSSPSTSMYNELVGDIVNVSTVDNHDGTSTMYFTVRCPLESTEVWWKMLREHPEHQIPVSPAASQAVYSNRQAVGPSLKKENMIFFADTGEERGFPPFIIIEGLPSENIEPVTLGSGYLEPGYHPKEGYVLPTMVMPPVWGAPTQPLPKGVRRVAQDGMQGHGSFPTL